MCYLMDYTSRNMEDGSTKIYLNAGGLVLGFSKEKNFIMFPRDHSCDILVMKVTAYCPYLKPEDF